ncbi:hypothetical protein J1N35_045528 [Gossypium stocksii]|uniref:Uncharacterized protein n=1 Tax=Gossypium stocksii TaxID=47602 RepID=A0A9D3UBB2_9ROSI|nr:hypothetical protein J1N35_045528 [Gossypium stocksii]
MLDDEFNKVDKFYRAKAQALRSENPPGIHFDRSLEMTSLAASSPSGAKSASMLSLLSKPFITMVFALTCLPYLTFLFELRHSEKAAHLEAIEESTHGQADDDDNGDQAMRKRETLRL